MGFYGRLESSCGVTENCLKTNVIIFMICDLIFVCITKQEVTHYMNLICLPASVNMSQLGLEIFQFLVRLTANMFMCPLYLDPQKVLLPSFPLQIGTSWEQRSHLSSALTKPLYSGFVPPPCGCALDVFYSGTRWQRLYARNSSVVLFL